MTTQTTSINDSEAYPCPAALDWWDRDQFDAYYLPSKAELAKLANPQASIRYINCPERPPKPQVIGTDLVMQYQDQTWKEIPMEITWQLGQFSMENLEIRKYQDHWHTSFELGQKHIHIDYIDGPYGSPLVKRREYRVFSNGQEIGRGGGKMGFIMAVFGNLRYYPLIIYVDEYLIYLKRMLQPFGLGLKVGQIDPEDVLTVWQRV